MPRNKKEEKTITKLKRPNDYQKLIDLVVRDCMKQRMTGRPVLVIFNYIYEAEKFAEALQEQGIECGLVDGQDAKSSQKAVERAGEAGRITIGTIFAGRGTDIKINGQLEKLGGLHVIVVSRMLNQRVLEQAIGRSGRNGQQGSTTIFSPELQGVGIAPFRDLYKNLDRLQKRLSEHIRNNWSWLHEAQGGGLGDLKYPFNTEVEDIFELSSRMISGTSFGEEDNKAFRNQLYDVVITSWRVFF